MSFPEPLTRLVEELQRLPGIGPKGAQRLAFHMLKAPRENAERLATAIRELKERVTYCSVCSNITDTDPCLYCSDETRDRHIICVVEEPFNIQPLERTGEFHGLYHVLLGSLSPQRGIGPGELRIDGLLARLGGPPPIAEVIVATNPNVEGEATALYLARLFKGRVARVSRLAFGMPVGGDIEYTDEVTLGRSLAGRRDI